MGGPRSCITRMGEKIPKVGASVDVGCQEPDFDTATMPEYDNLKLGFINLLHTATTLRQSIYSTQIFLWVDFRPVSHHVRNERIDICRCLFA